MKIALLITSMLIFGVAPPGPGTEQAVTNPVQNDKSDTGCSLRIHVDGLRNSTGVVGAVIFASPEGWPENTDKSLHHWPSEIPQGKHEATAIWENLPPGNYGVAVIHDENKNRKLDRNFLGIPKEGFGFANNPHVGLSAPAFDAARVHMTCPVTEITIHLQYK